MIILITDFNIDYTQVIFIKKNHTIFSVYFRLFLREIIQNKHMYYLKLFQYIYSLFL